jgi:D,D-heptose 1,7-bisphosphate phosphatase
MKDYFSPNKSNFEQAIFLDRDGTINVDTHYPHRVEDLLLIPRSLDALKLLAALPYQIILITNQSGIAHNIYKKDDMTLFNRELIKQITIAGGRVDAIYYCPHFENSCTCSKPAAGMLLEAAHDNHVKLEQSFMVGDKTSDVKAGENAGCKNILLLTGKAGKEDGALKIQPHHTANDLFDAVIWLKRQIN